MSLLACDRPELTQLRNAISPGGEGHAAEKEEKPAEHGSAHWDYKNPETWPELCKTGQVQSPIDIQKTYRTQLGELRFDYARADFAVVNNGHTIQVQSPSAGGFALDDTRFELLQFHFHGRSEHLIKGKAQDMEAHFVHKDATGSLAVIGVLIKKGLPNSALEIILKNAPEKAGEKAGIALSIAELFPRTPKYYTYTGSLTTPTCSEGLKWIVMKDPVEASEEQIVRFKKLFAHNARPVQSLHHRMVLESE